MATSPRSDPGSGSPEVLAAEIREPIRSLLARARQHLGLDVCFVGEIDGDRRVIQLVDGAADAFGIHPGDSAPSIETYCALLLDETLPTLIADTAAHPIASTLPATTRHGIGAHIGVPILLPSGRVFGALCAASHLPRTDLDERDVGFMRVIADLVAEQVAAAAGPELVDPLRVADRLAEPHALRIVFQPIVELGSRRVVGYEALSRFTGVGPADVFAEAWRTGIGLELELKALRRAFCALPSLPTHCWLSVNVAPRTIISEAFGELLDEIPGNRIVLEVTEHDAVESYDRLMDALESMLDRGVRLALDDVGSGYSSLEQIVELSPDIIKLDAVFTRGVDAEPVRRAMTTAFRRFARDIDATVIVEGVETRDQAEAVHELGIRYAQGFHVGLPTPIERLI